MLDTDPLQQIRIRKPWLKGWVVANSRGRVDPETLCPWESGRQLLRLPEIDFLRR